MQTAAISRLDNDTKQMGDDVHGDVCRIYIFIYEKRRKTG